MSACSGQDVSVVLSTSAGSFTISVQLKSLYEFQFRLFSISCGQVC